MMTGELSQHEKCRSSKPRNVPERQGASRRACSGMSGVQAAGCQPQPGPAFGPGDNRQGGQHDRDQARGILSASADDRGDP